MNEEGKRTKKARRTGQIIARGPNKWLVRIFTGRDASGVKHYHSETVKGNKKVAERCLTALLTRHHLGEPLRQTEITLDEFTDQWLDVVKTRTRERTWKHYAEISGLYIRPAFGKKRLVDISAADVQGLYARLQDRGLSATTIRYVHTLFCNLFQLAMRRDMIRKNPMLAVEPPARKQKEMVAMSAEQIRKFLTAAEGRPESIIFAFAFFTGARPCEYLGLKWSDLEGDRITIQRSIHWRKSEDWYFEEPKTAKGKRSIKLSSEIMRKLADYRTCQLEARMRAGSIWQPNDFIFTNEIGEPISKEPLRETFKKILTAAGLPDSIRLYDTRHSCATALMGAGVHIKVVSERLGHSNSSITMDVYSHVMPGQQDEASAELEKAIFG